jgi:hypothetical protein
VNTQSIIKVLGAVLLYLFLQVFVVRNLVFFDVAFCFVYISIILFIPNTMPISALLLIAFLVGILVDMFYNTAGLHAGACVFIAYLRSYILKILFPAKGLDNEVVISLEGLGTERFIRYIVILTFLHHLFLFFVETGTLFNFLNTSLKIVASVLFTSLIVFLLHIYFKSLQNS